MVKTKKPTEPGTIPVLDRFAAIVTKAAAQDQSRPVLCGLAIKNGQAVSADGFMIMSADLATTEADGAIDPGKIVLDAKQVDATIGKTKAGQQATFHPPVNGTVPVELEMAGLGRT